MKSIFSIPKRLDDKIRYLTRYTEAVRSRLSTVLIGEIFCQAIADGVWHSSAEIAHEIAVHETTVEGAIQAYRASNDSCAVDLKDRVTRYKEKRDPFSLVLLGSEILRARSLGYAVSVPAVGKKCGLSSEEASFAAGLATLPAYVLGCVLILPDVTSADLKRIKSLAERDGWGALDDRAKVCVTQHAARRLSKAGVFRLLGTGRF